MTEAHGKQQVSRIAFDQLLNRAAQPAAKPAKSKRRTSGRAKSGGNSAKRTR